MKYRKIFCQTNYTQKDTNIKLYYSLNHNIMHIRAINWRIWLIACQNTVYLISLFAIFHRIILNLIPISTFEVGLYNKKGPEDAWVKNNYCWHPKCCTLCKHKSNHLGGSNLIVYFTVKITEIRKKLIWSDF